MLNPVTSAEPGRWKTSRTPYLKGIMDAFTDPLVEEITIMAASQVGKTESMYNMLGFIIDQDPGPTLMVLPRENDAKSISYNRVLPMIEGSKALMVHMTPIADDITRLEYHLDRMILYFAGSNSPADLAGRPIRYLFLDEVDKYPRFSGREADPIKLASERQKTFWNKKTVKVSTPTTRDGYIHREYEKSDRRKFYVPCPQCGKYQILVFGQIKWPKEERSAEKIRNERLAWYECFFCQGRIEDYQKGKILLQGQWVPDGCEIADDGSIRGAIVKSKHHGFWINSLYSPWLTWSDVAAEFLKSKDYVELLMNFVNSWLAEVWEERVEETSIDKIRALAGEHEEGMVPEEAILLTAGVDVQKDHFYATIRAWGYQQRSWNILAVRLEEWEDVIRVLFKTTYPSEDANIEPFPVRLTCIDTGYRTSEVYEICSAWRDVARPIKGRNQLGGIPYRISTIERFPDSGVTIPGGLALWSLDTSYFKDKVRRLMQNTSLDGPGGWFIHRNPPEEYVKQLCSEHKAIIRDKKTRRAREEWRPVSAHAATHFWDCEIYSAAAAEMLRVFYLQENSGQVIHRSEQHKNFSYKNWIPRKPNWNRRHG